MLTPYLAYLEKRYQQGRRNAQQLWRELCQQGYPDSDSQPIKWLNRCRNEDMLLAEKRMLVVPNLTTQPSIALPKPPIELPTAQQISWLMVRPIYLLVEADQHILIHVCQGPVITQVYQLPKEFAIVVRQRQMTLFDE